MQEIMNGVLHPFADAKFLKSDVYFSWTEHVSPFRPVTSQPHGLCGSLNGQHGLEYGLVNP